ncbi:MAG: hypothetical protein F6K23_16775 [Okeania sp. SIO2C9]|uniref:hypothetical protein n=1 Tax=Okeania sp. SIO2C9 TaxID=2607791 RepID=UPI0013C26EC7|nr:hypothetical protein [Okeania sp. SIO2C9]NEQ74544.1 hypothetical protein [Okeania sp. SIO2C9]
MKLAGIFGENCQQQTIKSMADAQIRAQLNKSEIFKVSGGFMAKITTATGTTGNIYLHRTSTTNNQLIIAGIPIITNGNLEQKLNQIVELDYQTAAEALTEFDGAFVALYWDQKASKLAIVTDILGMQPLYMARVSGKLLVASEIKAIAASGLIDLEMNPGAWGAFVTFGHTLGNDTTLDKVKRVPPGAILIYDHSSDRLEEKNYWHWPQPQPEKTLADVDTGQIIELLEQNIKGYLAYQQPGTILLSGGFDSRLLLALLYKMGIDARTVILTHEDEFFGADGIYAEWVAKKVRASVKRISSDPDFFSSQAYLDYLVMNEVATPSLFLFISQVLQHLEPNMGAVWEGCYPGAILVPVGKQPRGGFSEYLATLAMPPNSPQWQAIHKIFAPSLAKQIQTEFLEKLEAEKSQYSDDGFGVSEFIIRNRTRNRIAPNPLQIYFNIVPTFTPGLTKDFWAIAAALPFEVKTEFRLYKQIFQQHFPKMLTVPFVSGGKLVSPQAFSLWHEIFMNAYKLQLALGKGKIGRGLLKILGVPPHQSFFQPSQFLGQVIGRVDIGHPDLNSDQVRLIQDFTNSNPGKFSYEQELLFYWQVWRWLLQKPWDNFQLNEI